MKRALLARAACVLLFCALLFTVFCSFFALLRVEAAYAEMTAQRAHDSSLSYSSERLFSAGESERSLLCSVDPADFPTIAESSGALDFAWSAEIPVVSYNLNAIDSLPYSGGTGRYFQFAGHDVYPQIKLVVCSDLAVLDDFQTGARKIVNGVLPLSDDTLGCAVSEEFARKNELGIGSLVSLMHYERWDVPFYFRVVGVFHDASAPFSDYAYHSSYCLRKNEVLISSAALKEKYFNRREYAEPIPIVYTVRFSYAHSDGAEALSRAISGIPAYSVFSVEDGASEKNANTAAFETARARLAAVFTAFCLTLVAVSFCCPAFRTRLPKISAAMRMGSDKKYVKTLLVSAQAVDSAASALAAAALCLFLSDAFTVAAFSGTVTPITASNGALFTGSALCLLTDPASMTLSQGASLTACIVPTLISLLSGFICIASSMREARRFAATDYFYGSI